jgi:hypothetical protein
MTWPPELELIEQLCGEDMTLRRVITLFDNADHARRVLSNYHRKRVVVFVEQGVPLADWKVESLLRDPEPFAAAGDVIVSLSDKGANAFEEATWDKL